MKTIHYSSLLLLLILIQTACSPGEISPKEGRKIADNLSIEWELISNQVADHPKCRCVFTLKNGSRFDLGMQGWAIFFNQDVSNLVPGSYTGSMKLDHLGGDFFRLAPQQNFQLRSGDETMVQVDFGDWLIKEEQAPLGVYMVFYDSQGIETSRHALTQLEIKPFVRSEQLNRFTFDETPDPTPEWQFEQNQRLSKLEESSLPLIIPTPSAYSKGRHNVSIGQDFLIRYSSGLSSEAEFLARNVKDLFGMSLEVSEAVDPGEGIIQLMLEADKGYGPESYHLELSENKGVRIEAGDASGVFYGIQSLLALVPLENYREKPERIMLPEVILDDGPRFQYRGMHLDVARNFNGKEAVFKLIDVMSFYKLNTLHLHLTDDEGWRLHISQLPELTEIGAFRGHTMDDSLYLHPSYGSGPEPDPSIGYGSGFYTREDFIQILHYARERHIEVIPEFDLPGHARAAIKAMDARYQRFMKEADKEKALEYLLSDPGDSSVYYSAQRFDDNVICVCRNSTYRFIETVVDEVIDMYNEAGVPLRTIHIGGDEVPSGAWEGSPICAQFQMERGQGSGAEGLMDYFLERTEKILMERNLILSGWEEITLDRGEGRDYSVKAPGDKRKFQVYIWDNFTRGNQDIGYRIANAGYPVILCSVTNFYFELAYNKHPQEPGHYWGGFVDTYKAFEYIPLDVFKSIHATPLGRPYVPEIDFINMTRLDKQAEKNILGLQGALWSEPIKGPQMLEYFYLPKMLGLAERAWGRQPKWATEENRQIRRDLLLDDWNDFANALGQRELPRLDYLSGGYNYRLAPPGLKYAKGKLYANTQFPGLKIRYTTDGNEPSADSDLYTGPVELTKVDKGRVRASTFSSGERGSRVVGISIQ